MTRLMRTTNVSWVRHLPHWVSGALLLAACGSPPSATGPAGEPPKAEQKAATDAWRAAAPAPGQRRAFTYPTPTSSHLDNLVSLYVVERDTPLVVATLILRRGSTLDPPGKSGLAALTARMLTEGTKSKSDRELAEASEDLGSEFSSAASRDTTTLSFEFLAEDLPRALDLMVEAFTQPRFDPGVFARVKAQWLDELTSERQEPASLAAIAGMRATLGLTWGAPTQGSLTGVRALSVKDLKEFHQKYYKQLPTALVIAGGVEVSSVAAEANRAFQAWRSDPTMGSPPPQHPPISVERPVNHKPPPPGKFGRILLVDRADSVQAAVFVGQSFPARGVAGYETRELLNQVLGGMFTSRLNQNLREKHGFTYGARSYNYAQQNLGAWFVATSVRTDSTAQALREILSEVSSARQTSPITPDELDRARQELLGSYAAHLEQSSTVVADISDLFTNQLAPTYFAELGTLLSHIDAESVGREAVTHLAPQSLTAVVVGDKKQILEGLKTVGVEVTEAPPELID